MKNIPLSPRKQPTQDRARATMDVILQAAAYILEYEGWTRFTTNRVAEKAGVNIASLYQYFPNKQALVEALRRIHVEQSRQAVIAASADATCPLSAMVRAVLAAHRVSPALHRVFTEELPRQALSQGGECLDDPELTDLIRPHFGNTPSPDLAMFVARTAMHAVIHEAVCHHPEYLSHPQFESELVRLLRAYLGEPAPKPSAQSAKRPIPRARPRRK